LYSADDNHPVCLKIVINHNHIHHASPIFDQFLK
jgi:hypothetical protein